MPTRFICCLLLLIFQHAAFAGIAPLPDTAQPAACLVKAQALLDEAFTFIKKSYYRKDAVDWSALIASSRQKLMLSENCDEVYDIIGACFRELNESHSFLMPPSRAAIYNNESVSGQQQPLLSTLVGEIRSELLDNGIAYLSIPWVSTTDSLICQKVADSLQMIIASLDQRKPYGWIIDLRKNTGGNCWPMLAGIGPLLGDGVCGYFVSSNEKIPISYNAGTAFQGKNARCRASTPYQLRASPSSIIVLTGNRTVSSGEIIALAFKGRNDVQFYGEPTAGYTTANATYTLSDRSMLVLSVCMEADRTGKICEGKIIPDEIINSGGPGTGDPVRDAALMWLNSIQPVSVK